MSKWNKLISEIKNLSKDLRFNEIKKILNHIVIGWIAPLEAQVIEYLENKEVDP